MTSSKAAHKPSDLEPKFYGETRDADGYQFWTTSQEDEEAVTISDQIEAGTYVAPVSKKPRRKLFKPGVLGRTGARLGVFLLLAVLIGIAYLAFNYTQVADAAGDDQTREADAAIVLGAAQYNGAPSYVLLERLDHAYNLYNDGTVDRIFVTGAGAEGDITTEGLVGLEHLMGKGVPEDDISLIPEGSNSWEQLSASATEIDNLRSADDQIYNVLLVSDGYHSYRLLQIADELGLDAYVSPSAVEGTVMNSIRESAAVSIGRITGYRRLSAFTEN